MAHLLRQPWEHPTGHPGNPYVPQGSLGFSGWAASIGLFREIDLGLTCSLFASFLFIPGSAILIAIICLCEKSSLQDMLLWSII